MQQILCGSDQQKWVKRLSLQRSNFLCGVELIVKGHFNADGQIKGHTGDTNLCLGAARIPRFEPGIVRFWFYIFFQSIGLFTWNISCEKIVHEKIKPILKIFLTSLFTHLTYIPPENKVYQLIINWYYIAFPIKSGLRLMSLNFLWISYSGRIV